MGILDTLASQNTSTSNKPATDTSAGPRKTSEIWLNIGANIRGAGEDGSDLFLSLPSGLPLDDMKPVRVTGSNQNSVQIKQGKNALLDELQKFGASMAPGERRIIPLSVEIYRVAQPNQVGSVDDNPLIKALFGALKG